jgi:adenylyl- and sulfurtransferase ThiI
MNNILIVRYGEVALKGMNKPWFERILEGRVVKSLNGAGALRVERREGLIIVSGFETNGDGSSVRAGTDEPAPFVHGDDRRR